MIALPMRFMSFFDITSDFRIPCAAPFYKGVPAHSGVFHLYALGARIRHSDTERSRVLGTGAHFPRQSGAGARLLRHTKVRMSTSLFGGEIVTERSRKAWLLSVRFYLVRVILYLRFVSYSPFCVACVSSFCRRPSAVGLAAILRSVRRGEGRFRR